MKGRIFGSKTIKSKLMSYNFIIICVIAIFVSFCSYLTANKKTKEVAQNSLQYHVANISYRYQIAYEEMLNIVLICTERKEFDLGEIQQMKSVVSRVKAMGYSELIKDFCAITEYGTYISRLSVFNEHGAMIQAGTSLGSNNDYKRILDSVWFEQELQKTMDYYQLDLVKSPFYQDHEPVLPIARKISSADHGGDGWVLLCLSTRLFQDVLKENIKGQEAVVVTSTGRRIASIYELEENQEENDRIIKQLLQREDKEGLLEMKVHGKDSLVAYQQYMRSGILIYETIPLDSLTDDKTLMIQTIAAMFGACLIIGLFLSVIFSNQVKKPIDRLVTHIEGIAEGRFTQDKELESEDEIGIVGKVVNDMSRQIETLMEQRVEDEKEKSSLELKMLQAQINPHFLYNTLDSIKWIAVIQKNSGIVKVVTALSSLLKNMAKGFDEKVTVQKELDFLKDYVTIEKVKYVELFDLVVEVDDPLLDQAKIIKLTLQPLVENAIFNGIEPGGKSGTIRIHVFSKEEVLFITVRDDGMGIPPAKLKTLLRQTETIKSDHMSGIGLPNVDRRIKLNYGDEYGLAIESEVGVYTQITVKVPLEYDRGGKGE